MATSWQRIVSQRWIESERLLIAKLDDGYRTSDPGGGEADHANLALRCVRRRSPNVTARENPDTEAKALSTLPAGPMGRGIHRILLQDQ